jgi:hypothetical protein
VAVFEKRYETDAGEHVATVTWHNAAAEDPPHKLGHGVGVPLGEGDKLPLPPSGELADRGAIDTLAPGQRLPDLVEEIDISMMVRWTAVLWDMGTPHFDWVYARDCYDLPSPLVHGPMLAAFNRRVLTDWMHPRDQIVSHRTRLRGVSACGDHAIVQTSITTVDRHDDHVLVGVESTMINQWGGTQSLGAGVCRLALDA